MNTSLFLFTPREVVCDKIESCKSALKLFASKVSDTYYVASYLSLYTTEATMRVQWRLSSKAAFYLMVPWMVASIITTLPGLESLSWKATHLAIFVVGRRGCPSHKQGEPLHTATYENKNKQRVKRSQTWQPTRSQTKSHEKGEGYTRLILKRTVFLFFKFASILWIELREETVVPSFEELTKVNCWTYSNTSFTTEYIMRTMR